MSTAVESELRQPVNRYLRGANRKLKPLVEDLSLDKQRWAAGAGDLPQSLPGARNRLRGASQTLAMPTMLGNLTGKLTESSNASISTSEKPAP